MNERLDILFDRQLTGDISLEDRLELLELIADPSNETQVNALLDKHSHTLEAGTLTATFQPGRAEALLNTLLTEHVHPSQRPAKTVKLWPRVAAAVALLIVAFGMGFYFWGTELTGTTQRAYDMGQEIVPGARGATLTLANGQMIRLSDADSGELVSDAGVMITKSADGKLIYKINTPKDHSNQLNTLATAKGEMYEVYLPDGSRVLLNAASALTYSVNLLQNGKRLVKLEGEGYFEIARDEDHPFIVQSKGQEIEVLGTHFNVKAYADEPATTTTLLEGSVQVNYEGGKRRIVPGEQAIYDGAAVRVGKANIEQIMGWARGDFDLNRVDFKTAMRDIARWYDVELVYDASVPGDLESGGWIARDKPLSTVLRSIEASGMAKFKVVGRTIYITP